MHVKHHLKKKVNPNSTQTHKLSAPQGNVDRLFLMPIDGIKHALYVKKNVHRWAFGACTWMRLVTLERFLMAPQEWLIGHTYGYNLWAKLAGIYNACKKVWRSTKGSIVFWWFLVPIQDVLASCQDAMPTQKIGITHNHNFPAETAGEGTTFHCSGYHPAFDRRHHCLQPRQHKIDPLTSGYLIYEMRDNEVMIKKRGAFTL